MTCRMTDSQKTFSLDTPTASVYLSYHESYEIFSMIPMIASKMLHRAHWLCSERIGKSIRKMNYDTNTQNTNLNENCCGASKISK